MSKVYVVGIGPGEAAHMTKQTRAAMAAAICSALLYTAAGTLDPGRR